MSRGDNRSEQHIAATSDERMTDASFLVNAKAVRRVAELLVMEEALRELTKPKYGVATMRVAEKALDA